MAYNQQHDGRHAPPAPTSLVYRAGLLRLAWPLWRILTGLLLSRDLLLLLTAGCFLGLAIGIAHLRLLRIARLLAGRVSGICHETSSEFSYAD